jgi:hypothetical protein
VSQVARLVLAGGAFTVAVLGVLSFLLPGPLARSGLVVVVDAFVALCWLGLALVWALILRLTRAPGRVCLAALAGTLVAGTVTMGAHGISPRSELSLGRVEPEQWFEEHRSDYERALTADPISGEVYEGALLPEDLQYLSADGSVNHQEYDEGPVAFFVQFYDFRRESGAGFVHATEIPESATFASSDCAVQVDLGDDWWYCSPS